ncbi:hypothetical protein JA9_003534 [Meyerozyma sp. JA9]|nr:hypothetical protein JA9_003534 [Meyerozyma sp. JA9]
MVHNEKIWCRLVRRLSKSRKKAEVHGESGELDFVGEFGPVERDPWPTPVSSAASSEYSDSEGSEDESEDESEERFVEMELANDITEVSRIGPIDPTDVSRIDPIDPTDVSRIDPIDPIDPSPIDPTEIDLFRSANVRGIDTKVSLLFLRIPESHLTRLAYDL